MVDRSITGPLLAHFDLMIDPQSCHAPADALK
jgi:hypothetical protein